MYWFYDNMFIDSELSDFTMMYFVLFCTPINTLIDFVQKLIRFHQSLIIPVKCDVKKIFLKSIFNNSVKYTPKLTVLEVQMFKIFTEYQK